MLKTKSKQSRQRQKVNFIIRRITNRNPRNARAFLRIDKKIRKAVAAYFLLVAFIGAVVVSGGVFTDDLESSVINLSNNSAQSLSKLEEAVMFCDSEESCKEAEENLQSARQEIEQIEYEAMLDREASKVERKYTLEVGDDSLKMSKNSIEKILNSFAQTQAIASKSRIDYERCLEKNDGDELACTSYSNQISEAVKEEDEKMSEIREVKFSLEKMLTVLDDDISVIKTASKDSSDLTKDAGLGWCQQVLAEKIDNLKEKMNAAAEFKLVYDNAVSRLGSKKLALLNLDREITVEESEVIAESSEVIDVVEDVETLVEEVDHSSAPLISEDEILDVTLKGMQIWQAIRFITIF